MGSYDTWSQDNRAPKGKYRLIEMSALNPLGDYEIVGDYDSIEVALNIAAIDSDPAYRFAVYEDQGKVVRVREGDWFKKRI